MNIVAFIIGFGIPMIPAWLAIRCLESVPVLTRAERLLWSFVTGPILMTLVLLILRWLQFVTLDITGYITAICVLTVPLFAAAWFLGRLRNPQPEREYIEGKPKGMVLAIVIILVAWSAIKVLGGAYNILTVPTYWDDSFNNWNMRGKIIYESKDLDIFQDGEQFDFIDPRATGSYPPAVPMMKGWITQLANTWSDSLVNSMHIAWYLCLIALFALFLRRHMSMMIAAIGTYALISLPLLHIHGTNPYVDVLVATLVFLSMTSLYEAAISTESATARTWFFLAVFAASVLSFTKNEAIALHIPVIGLLGIILLWKKKEMFFQEKKQSILFFTVVCALPILIVAPWMLFKIINGLTFGNAKSVSDLPIAFDKTGLESMWFFLTKEANFLFLPLLCALLMIAYRRITFHTPIVVFAVFVLIVIAEQAMLYAFTPLRTEAINQTGMGRGFVQLIPIILTIVLFTGKELLTHKE